MNIEQLTGEDIVATELPRKFNGNFANVKQEVESHINNKNNPHKVTAEQLGLASAYIYQGDVETFQNLPTQGVQKGWVYNVKAEFTLGGATYPAGTDVAWDGTKWNTLGGSLKGYVRKVNNVVPDSNANVNVKNLIATKLVNGQDLNNIKAEGRYQCDTNSVATTLLNSPIKTAFYLDVFVNDSSSSQVKQVITANAAEMRIFMRTLVNDSWSGWQRVQFVVGVHDIQEIRNTSNVPIKLTGSFSHKYTEIAGKDISLASNIDVYWVTPATSDIGVTINLSALTKQSGYSRFVTIYVDGSKCPNLRTITYTNVPSGFTLKNEPEKMMGGMVNVIGIEIVGTGNIYTITNNGSSESVKQNFEFFNSLQQIGITPGSETLISIAKALPKNAVLSYYVSPNVTVNHSIYPDTYGHLVVTGLINDLVQFEFTSFEYNTTIKNRSSTRYLTSIRVDDDSTGYTLTWARLYDTYSDPEIKNNWNKTVTTVDELKNLKGNCFFQGGFGTEENDPLLSGVDFQGISMRYSNQALQLVCMGTKSAIRIDDSHRPNDTTPNYGEWTTIVATNDKLLPLHFKNFTRLAGGLGQGDIVLSKPYTDFDGLYFEYTDDNRNFWSTCFISSWELTHRIDRAKAANHPYVELFSGLNFWRITTTGTTTKLLKSYDDNCYIEHVYGVTL